MPDVYRVAICDDDKIHLEDIRKIVTSILGECRISFQVYPFISHGQLLKSVKSIPNAFDLILLDIFLADGVNGVQVARRLRQYGCASRLVFVTVTPDFAIEGYEVGAYRYVLKPIEENDLKKIILSDLDKRAEKQRITIKKGNRVWHIPAEDIIYIETHNRGIRIHLADEQIDLYEKLSEIAHTLPQSMLARCHRSFIVNLAYIRHIERYELTLRGELYIPVSRKYYDAIKQKFIERLVE